MNKPVCEHEGCECDAPRKVNPIKLFLSVLYKCVLVVIVVLIVVAFIFRMLLP